MYKIILKSFKFGDFPQNHQLKASPKFPAIQYDVFTLWQEVLADIKDAVALYKDLIHSDQPSLNLYLSPQDVFIVDHLSQVPDSWEFNVWWDWGELDSIDIKVPGFDWDRFEPDAFNRQAIDERYLSG